MATNENKRNCIIVLVVIGAVVALVTSLVTSSLKKLESTEVGVSYDTIQRSLSDEVKLEGLHTGPPGFQFIKFPSVRKTISFTRLKCINKDGVIVFLDVDFQYQVSVINVHSIITEFKDHDTYSDVLKLMAKASIQLTCSQFDTSQFQSERNVFQSTILDVLQQRLSIVRCLVADVQVNEIIRPSAYESAIQKKEAARENIEVARQQRPNRLTKAKTVLREAVTEANIILERAASQAKIRLNQANRTAEAIINRYTVEALSFEKVKADLGLDTPGVLSYIGVRTISSCPNPVFVGLKSPAKTSYAPP